MAINVADYLSGGTGTNLTDGYFSNPVTTAEPSPTFAGTVFEGTDYSGGEGSSIGGFFDSVFGGASDVLNTAGGTFSDYLNLKNQYDSLKGDNTAVQQAYQDKQQNATSSSSGLKVNNNTLIYAGVAAVALYFVMGD